MLGDVVRKAGEGAGGAVVGPTAGLADAALGYLLGPWGIAALVVVFLALRVIR